MEKLSDFKKGLRVKEGTRQGEVVGFSRGIKIHWDDCNPMVIEIVTSMKRLIKIKEAK